MNNILKKVFSFSVVVTTIMWSVGVAGLVNIVTADAAVCPTLAAGDMIKVKAKPAIYAVNNNLEVLYFPSGDEFKSWRPTYGGYISITQECFDTLSVPSTYPGAVNYHPGSYVVKRPSSDQLYVVEPNNTLAKITPELAQALYGVGYKVMTVADTFWPHYVNRGTDVTTAVAHPGMLVKVDGTIYYIDADGKARVVTATGFTANGFQEKFVHTLTAAAIAGLTIGVEINAEVPAITDKTQSGGVTTPVVVGGAFTASLSADSPSGVQPAKGSAYNDVLHVTLTAGSKAVSVTGVTLQKTGLLSRTDITGVSVWVDGVRHGSIATALDDNGYVTIGFGNSPIELAANSSKVVAVKVNISSTISIFASFTMGMTAVESNGTVSGLPVLGNSASVTNGTLASYTVTAGTVSGYATEAAASAASGQLEIGDLQKEIGKWTFAESGNEDLKVETLTFYINGSISDEHLKNWTVYGPTGLALGTASVSDDRYVTVPVNYTLVKGSSKALTLKADIVDGSNKYFAVTLQNDYDIIAKGLSSGYYVLPGSFTSQTPTNAWFKIKQGDVSIQKAAGSPSGNVPAGSNDVVLAEFDVKALGEGLEVRKMALEVEAGQELDADLTGNIKVQSVDGATTYLSRTYSDFITDTADGDSSFATGTQWDLSTYINLASLQTKSLRVVATIADGATSADSYTVKIGSLYVKRLSTLDYQTKPNTTTAYPGNTLTVQAASLTAAKNTSVGNSTLAASSQNVTLGSFKLQGGSAEDVNVSQIVIDFGGSVTSTYLENVGLYDGTTLLGSEVVTPVTASNTYSVSLTVYKNQVRTIDIKGDIKSNAADTETHIATLSAVTATGVITGETAITSPMNITLQEMSYGSAQLKVTNDSSVESKVLLPSTTKQLIGISKYEAVNSDITLKKVTYAVRDGVNEAEGIAANFGDVELRKADGTVLATAPVVDSGTTSLVTFTGFSHKVLSGATDKLYLYAEVNASGVMTPASVNTVSIYSDANTYMEAYSDTGLLSTANIGDSNVAGDDSYFCTSSPMLFHNTAPVIARSSTSPSGTQTPNSETTVFVFTVNNPGARDMRIASTTIAVAASGMAGLGKVSSFKLYDGNTLLGTTYSATTTSATPSITVSFDSTNDESSRLDNLTLSAGETKTLKLTANTTDIRTGVASGSNVYLTASLDGATGYDAAADDYETDWANGKLYYYYTPISGSESGPYSASDSYDVSGNTLTF